MENKNLTAVFPHLKPPARLSDLMELSEVTRVTMNPENTLMCVYLASQQWIAKEDIYRLEECIEEQLFKNIKLKVKVIEKFRLSRQYSVENFYELYRPSILLELERYNKVLYSLMRNAGNHADGIAGFGDRQRARRAAGGYTGEDIYPAVRPGFPSVYGV